MLPGTNSIAPPFGIKTTHNPQSAFTESYALAEPGGPWRPTIALGRQQNLVSLFIQIICKPA